MAAFLHYSSTQPSGVPHSKVGMNQFSWPELILTIQVPFCRGGAGLQDEARMKSYYQSVLEIHAVKVKQIF